MSDESGLDSEMFHQLKSQAREESRDVPSDELISLLVGELENGESMSPAEAKALGMAYELDSRDHVEEDDDR